MQIPRALDWLNFFLADVRGGLGPHVNVYLLTYAHWTPERIGAVLTVSGLIGIAAHIPIGILRGGEEAKASAWWWSWKRRGRLERQAFGH